MLTRPLYLLAAALLFTPACSPEPPGDASVPVTPDTGAADLTARSGGAFFALDADSGALAARSDHPFLCGSGIRSSRCPAAVDWSPLGPTVAAAQLDQLARAGRLVVRGSWSRGTLGVREVLVRAGEDLHDDAALAALAALASTPAAPQGLCGDALRNALAAPVDGLLWPSESDYPISVTVGAPGGQGAILLPEIRALAGAPASAPVDARGLAPLGQLGAEYPGIDEAGKNQAARFRALGAVLAANLTGTGSYYVGKIDLRVLVLGRSRCGEIAGVISEVIET
jgi:hypothetical protein